MNSRMIRDWRDLIGIDAASAYRLLLLHHPEVQGATLFQYDSPPRMQERISVSPLDRHLIDRANDARETTGVPFWEALFARCAVEGNCSDSIISAAFFHNGQGKPRFVSREQIAEGILQTLSNDTVGNLALGSKITPTCPPARHISLVDFHCEASTSNLVIVRKICRELMPGGFLLLDSGGSYHACGVELVSDELRVQVLARALLASPIVDARYVAHQLLQESSSIRISRGGKLQKVPFIVDVEAPQGLNQRLRVP